MRILVNGTPRDVASSTLDRVLLELGYAEARIATAFDGDFVPVPQRAARVLREDCRIEIVSPMQGG